MLELDSHKLIVGNGPLSDRAEFFEYIQKNLKLYELRNGVSLNGPACANFIRGQLAAYLRKSPYQVNLLVAACDTEQEQLLPTLHWMDHMASMVKVNFGAHGYGAHFCLSIFDREWKPDMTLEEALHVMRVCRDELEERFLVRSGKWLYKVIDAKGIRSVEVL